MVCYVVTRYLEIFIAKLSIYNSILAFFGRKVAKSGNNIENRHLSLFFTFTIFSPKVWERISIISTLLLFMYASLVKNHKSTCFRFLLSNQKRQILIISFHMHIANWRKNFILLYRSSCKMAFQLFFVIFPVLSCCDAMWEILHELSSNYHIWCAGDFI